MKMAGLLLVMVGTVSGSALAADTLSNDWRAVGVYRDGLKAVMGYVESQPQLFPAQRLEKPRMLGREQREAVWTTWRTFLDHVVALDAIGKRHVDCWRRSGADQWGAFQAGYAAFLAQYRFATDFFARAGNDPWLAVLLNEPVPELGLPKDTYAKLRDRFLNAGRGAEFVALDSVYKALAVRTETPVQAVLEEDRKAVWKLGTGRGQVLTAHNALQYIRRKGFTVYLPVQTGVSEWMGDTKVARPNRSLISAGQIAGLIGQLQPGDVLLERREWYLSNAGLPGFWPHAALYIGTPAERVAFFGHDKLERELQNRYPDAYAASLRPENKHERRVLEAISEGVSFTSIEHSADCDSLAVLRPRRDKDAIAGAIRKAFQYSGRPYDFNFDFRTDASLVCTELVYKSYEGQLQFELVEMLGRPLLPANEIVRQFAESVGTDRQQFEMVLFLDGQERDGKAELAGVAEFCRSWQRPKWHILQQTVNFGPDARR